MGDGRPLPSGADVIWVRLGASQVADAVRRDLASSLRSTGIVAPGTARRRTRGDAVDDRHVPDTRVGTVVMTGTTHDDRFAASHAGRR